MKLELFAPLFILVQLQFVESYNVLVVFLTPSFSHQRAPTAVTKALAEHGHQVTIMTTDPFETSNSNIKQIDISFLYEDIRGVNKAMVVGGISTDELVNTFKTYTSSCLRKIFSNEAARNIFTNENLRFDAIIAEYQIPGYPLAHALAEKYNATLIGMSTFEMDFQKLRAMGNPVNPIVNPPLFPRNWENPNLLQRTFMVLETIITYFGQFTLWELHGPYLKKYVPENKLTMHELMYDRVDVVIECVSPAQGYARPLLPNTIQIGFLHIEPPKPLPNDLQNYLDAAVGGVIYVNFGSNVHSVIIKPDLIKTIQTALGRLQYDVLWKYENSSMPNKPENVKILNWVPQQDLLAHPNVKLFIMQGGFQSLEETISREVPAVVIPFFGDQFANAVNFERLGIGKMVDKEDLTAFSLQRAILEVIRNPSYKKKIKEIHRQIRDTPMNATETAVWHIEHAIRNRGAEMFKYKGKNLPFYKFYMLDVCAFLIAILLILSLTSWKLSVLGIRKVKEVLENKNKKNQ